MQIKRYSAYSFAISVLLILAMPKTSHSETCPKRYYLRSPLKKDNYQRIIKFGEKEKCVNSIVRLLLDHFRYLEITQHEMKIANSISDQIREEDTLEKLANDSEFREYFLISNWLSLPENIDEVWDIADKTNLNKEDLAHISRKISEKIKTITLILPDGRRIVSDLPRENIKKTVRFYSLTGDLDTSLKKSLRTVKPKKLRDKLECAAREASLDKEDILFLRSFIKNTSLSDSGFGEAVDFLAVELTRKKTSNIYQLLESKKIRLNDLIEAHRNYHAIVNTPRGAGESSFDFERDVIMGGMKPPSGDPDTARKEIELIDYILGLDESSVPHIFDESVFEIGRRVAWRSKRIRTVYDYLNMYNSLYPMRKNKPEAVEMSLVVMNKLYMFLNEYGGLLKKLAHKLEADTFSEDFNQNIAGPRLSGISITKTKILQAYRKVSAAKETSLAYDLFSELDFKLSENKYPTVIDRQFTAIISQKSGEAEVQNLLRRMDEIDFDSSRLIEFMAYALIQPTTFSTLKFPYVYEYTPLGYESENDPWEAFKREFKNTEEVEVTIKRSWPDKPAVIPIPVFGDRLDLMFTELLKNAVAYARMRIKKPALFGKIQEGFTETDEGWAYYIEDNNPGIYPSDLKAIFNVCESTGLYYKKFAGGGVGLAEVLKIADMHNAKIQVISRRGGQPAYGLFYKDGEFSEIAPAGEETELTSLKYPTGTKFIVTFLYPAVSITDKVAPETERGYDNELPLFASYEKKAPGFAPGEASGVAGQKEENNSKVRSVRQKTHRTAL